MGLPQSSTDPVTTVLCPDIVTNKSNTDCLALQISYRTSLFCCYIVHASEVYLSDRIQSYH